MLKTDTRRIITGAFARINSSPAIFFLLTSYFEAIQSYGEACLLPPGLLRLPLRREVDVTSRHAQVIALRGRSIHESLPSTALVDEICEVLEAAVLRLPALQAAGGDDYSCQRSDEVRRLPIC